MGMGYLTMDVNSSNKVFVKCAPPWRRGTPKGRGMDPPRRGGFCDTGKGQLMEAPQANNLAPPSGELSAEQTEGAFAAKPLDLNSQISNLKSSPQSGCSHKE